MTVWTSSDQRFAVSDYSGLFMVAPIGADVVVFLDLRMVTGDQILTRHRSTRHQLRASTAVVDRDPFGLFTPNTITVTDLQAVFTRNGIRHKLLIGKSLGLQLEVVYLKATGNPPLDL